MKVRWSPLPQQFADVDEVFDELRELVAVGDFTLGKAVYEFEDQFQEIYKINHAIGVGSGTDAIKIPLKACGVGYGDEVITAANTFWSTAGAINEVGAKNVFVDCDDSFCIDPNLIEAAITEKTKAIIPVHLTGNLADMPRIMEIAKKYDLFVIEDACQSMMGELNGQKAGSFGDAAAFSLHPLKIIHVWGDAGIIVTNNDEMNEKCRLLRNHGLQNRDEMIMFGYNARLDSTHAVVGKWILRKLEGLVIKRAENAAHYDAGLRNVSGITIPPRNPNVKHVYLNYVLFAERRDELLKYCIDKGIEAKVHYPVPLYLQIALKDLGHKKGDFPVSDRHGETMISFPVDQHLSTDEMDYVISTVQEFYN